LTVPERAFLDTNVLLYADDLAAGNKRSRALALLGTLIANRQAVLSTQVLQEYYVNATRKLGVAPEVARRKVEALSKLDIVVIQEELILAAIDLHRLERLSFWDALVIRSAASAGCRRLLSEDMASGRTIAGVKIENPFS
jgi:predicted nucleic acid-binding protein